MTDQLPVLAAVDFGAASGRALTLAARLAERLRLPLRVLHAETLEAPAYFTHDQMTRLEEERQAARAAASRHLDAFVRDNTGRPAELLLADAAPTDAILDASRDAALIVLGTHGRRGPSLWWLGSVAERVVRAASRPVLVVHDRPSAGEATGIRVLGPRAVAPEAWAWADRIGAALGVDVSEAPPAGSCDPARLRGAALVVAAAGRTDGGARLLDPAAVKVLRTCDAPVLFVPEPGH
jgi:nucleotide-binding universal stress UspA family protein